MTKRNRVSSTLGAYADMQSLLDTILEHGEADLPCTDEKAAYALRHRVYRFRAMLLKKAEADIAQLIESGLAAPGTLPSSPYDRIFIQIEGNVLRFRMRDKTTYASALRRPDGAPLEVSDDPLREQAAVLAKKLRLE